MAKPMYVTLDASVPNDESEDQDTRLVKRVSEEYKSKTFAELLEKMVDGSADEMNEQPYNAQEMHVASVVQGWLRAANSNPAAVALFAITKGTPDTPPQDIPISLNDKVSEYNDRIIKTETETGPSGEELNYQKLELSIINNIPGGYE